MGTRSTLLDARPQDYMSSGFVDWPFMTTHSWGENPKGKWFLEIHNDAYSKWASDAKFFRWSLQLYGTEFDPNSKEYKMAHRKDENEEKFNVVREASPFAPPNKDLSILNGPRNNLDVLPDGNIIDTDEGNIKAGCISKRLECTQEVNDCRTFTHKSVADLFCKCSEICEDVASTILDGKNSGEHETYNMGCSFAPSKSKGGNVAPKTNGEFASTSSAAQKASNILSDSHRVAIIVTKDPPFYCQFIPFFSY